MMPSAGGVKLCCFDIHIISAVTPAASNAINESKLELVRVIR